MRKWAEQARWTFWPVLFALCFFTLLAMHGGWWEKFGVEHMRPFYADTVTTLAGAETWHDGGDPYTNNYRDPYRRPHSYGPWWLWLASVGLERRDAWWLGTLTMLVFLVTAAVVVAPRTPWGGAALAALLVSPPFLLGLERGNSDLPMFVLLALAGWLLGRGARGSVGAAWSGAAVLVSAAALKFYPLISLVALWGQPGRAARRIAWGAFGAIVFFALWWLQEGHYVSALREAARPRSVFTFGLPLAPMSWELLGERRGWLLIGALPAGVALGWVMVRGWRAFWEALPIMGGRAAAAVAGGSAWLLCYVSTTNFGYRAVLLAFFWRYWGASKAGRGLIVLLLLTFWLEAPKYWFAGWLARQETVWAQPLVMLSGFGQMTMLGASAVVALMLLGWAWRRERASTAR